MAHSELGRKLIASLEEAVDILARRQEPARVHAAPGAVDVRLGAAPAPTRSRRADLAEGDCETP